MEEGFDNVLVVDGIPIIDQSKYDRLISKITKEFSKKGAPINADRITMPWTENKERSKG